VSHHSVALDTAEVGLMRLATTLAVLTPSLGLLQVLANLRDYRLPALAIAVWAGVLATAFWLMPRLRAGGLAVGETVAAIAIAVAAVAAIGLAVRPHPIGTALTWPSWARPGCSSSSCSAARPGCGSRRRCWSTPCTPRSSSARGGLA